MIWAEVGTMLAVVGLVYAFLRNFKIDIGLRFDSIEKRLDRMEDRFTSIDARFNSMDEKMFYMATGRTLAEAVMEERLRRRNIET